MNKRTKTCDTCQSAFEIDELTGEFAETFMRLQRWCPACMAARRTQAEQEQTNLARREREAKWQSVCPVLFRHTDLGAPQLYAPFVEAAAEWNPNGPSGLGFMGPSRLGKTRLLFMALRRAFDAGRSVAYITHNAFGQLCIDAASGPDEFRYEARREMERLKRVGMLLLDDLGKAPSSEQRDSDLEEIIDVRSSAGLPILWSANGHGEWLARRFGPDRGEPLVCRLAEFSRVVKAPMA